MNISNKLTFSSRYLSGALLFIFFFTILVVFSFSNNSADHRRSSSQPQPQLFDRRIQEFLQTRKCESQFFMIWISPAELFSNKQILAVETLFKSHPNACLTILSDSMDSPTGKQILKPISDHGFRILLISPDFYWLFSQTAAFEWFKLIERGLINTGEIPFAQNLSNLLRLAVLYKYGGIYIDTDFIVLKNFSRLRNSIGAQTIHSHTKKWSRLNNAVLIFDRAHSLLLEFIEEFVAGFDGSKWGHNGPNLVSRVVERVQDRLCSNFTVLPPMTFYPVNWIKIIGLFVRPNTQAQKVWADKEVKELNDGAYGVHLWNKQTAKLKIEEESVIGRLILDHCIICRGIFNSSSS